MPKHSKTGVYFEERPVENVKVNDIILVYGVWLTVTKNKLMVRHPFQLYNIQVNHQALENVNLCLSAGWTLKVAVKNTEG